MSELPAVKIQYGFNKSYPGTWTAQGVGAQTAPYKRGWYPQLPAVDSSGTVNAFCRVKKWLYVGGAFSTVTGQVRQADGTLASQTVAIPYLYRVSLEDGELDTTFNLSLNDAVYDMATDGENLFVAGIFLDVQGSGINRLMKLNQHGLLQTDFNATPDASCSVLAYRTGSSQLYVGGGFTVCGGEVRDRLALVSDSTGLAAAFDAGAVTGGGIEALAYDLSQDMLYVGGTFTNINASARNRIAKLDADTAAVQTWNPNANGAVYDIKLDYPLVYVGGGFTTIGGATREYLACLDQAATATAFDLSATLSTDVFAIALDTVKDQLYFAGGTATKGGAASFAGEVLSWEPNFTVSGGGFVSAVYAYKSTAFFGGDLTSYNGIGATTVTNKGTASIPFPLFRDSNTLFVKQTGAFSGAAGTYADPLRSMDYALSTGQSFDDQSAAGNNLTVTGVVHNPPESWTDPSKGYWMAGPFNDSNYLNVPAAIGTAFAASNAFTVQADVWIESLAAVNTVWDWQNATGEVVVSVATTGALNFNIHGTTATSAAGVITAKGWYTITVEKNPSGNLKRAWVAQLGKTPILVINTTQVATLGANTSNRLFKDRVNANTYLVGFAGPVFFMDAAVASTLGPRLDWRDSYSANCKGYYPMQTKCALEADVDLKYVCILDSEVYEEWFNWHVEGTSLYANDGCAPTFKPRTGAKPGTYGARVVGREVFATLGGGNAYIYVSKAGNDSTGARGNSALPFLTITAAIAATGVTAGDIIQIQDSGVYSENLNFTTAVYLQAVSGQVTTVSRGAAGTFLQGVCNGFYGILFKCPAESLGTYASAGLVFFWDCTLRNLAATSSSQSIFINCMISGTSPVSDSASTYGTYLSNCHISGTSKVTADDTLTLTVKRCTFELVGTVTNNIVLEVLASNSANKNFAFVDSCLFILSGMQRAVAGREMTGSSSNKAFVVSRCYIDARDALTADPASSNGFGVVTLEFVTAGTFSACVYTVLKTLVLGPCAKTSGFLLFSNGSAFSNVYAGFVNCAMLGEATIRASYAHGNFEVLRPSSTGIKFKVKNCISINAPTTEGFYFYSNTGALNGTLEVSGLIDDGSLYGILADAATTVNYSTTELIGANVTGASLVQANPYVLGAVAGDENIALSALSPGLFNGDADGTTDQGASWAWNVNQVDGAVLSGLIFDGAKNLGAGLANVSGVATSLEFVTVTNLGMAGVLGKEGAALLNCEGAQTNGPAFRIGGVSSSAQRSIAYGCAGAGFLYGAPDLEASHNSSWGCEYGHYDAASATGSLSDEVHSDNGVDAVASEAVAYSDVGSIGDDVVVSSTSVRTNPLYIDPYTGNLALQTLAAGYPFNSPAKGTGTDGSDMGAYEVEYGILSESYIELSMKGADADTGWLNPTDIPWQYVAIKGSEGEKPSGSSYSTAKATKRQWELRWGGTANMPLTQLIALNEVYRDAGPIKVAFDGCTFIPCIVLKSNAAKNDQIDGLYSNSDVPRPLDSLILREL